MGGTRKQAGPMDRTLCGRRSTRCRECSAPSLLFMGRTRIRCPCHDDERKVWNRYNANRSGIVPEGLNILGRMYSSAAFAPVFALLVLNFSGSCANDSCASILKGCRQPVKSSLTLRAIAGRLALQRRHVMQTVPSCLVFPPLARYVQMCSGAKHETRFFDLRSSQDQDFPASVAFTSARRLRAGKRTLGQHWTSVITIFEPPALTFATRFHGFPHGRCHLPDVIGCLGMRIWCREPESNRHAC